MELNEEHKGSYSMEFMFLTPIAFFMIMLVVQIFCVTMVHVYYNNMATLIAHDLNMRQGGYEVHSMATVPVVEGNNSSPVQVTCDPSNAYFQGAVNYSVNKYKNMSMPFVTVKSVSVTSSKEIKAGKESTYAGAVITVTITYGVNVFGVDTPLTIEAKGYDCVD